MSTKQNGLRQDGQGSNVSAAEDELIRTIERNRLHALVSANLELAERLHADDFQLINPAGVAISKKQYLGDIASGKLKYLLWKPDMIQVRLHDQMAVIRYQSQMEVVFQGNKASLRAWHTDSYEKRNGNWQVVWSQATEIR